MKLLRTIALDGPLHHVQGIDVDGGTLWVSSVDRVARSGHLFSIALPSGRIQNRTGVADGDRFHPGGLQLDGDDLWLPVAEYRRSSTTQMQRRDRRTLRLLTAWTVNDHIGCVAVGRDRLFGGNWDSLDIYEWARSGKPLSKRTNITGTRYQDMKLKDGRLAASGLRGKGKGAIDWLDPKSLELVRRVDVETTDRGVVLTNEGMALKGETLYLLPEDDPSRLFVFSLA
ncbi:MAG: hypothetical protein FJW30_29750 [Acidobacteria bacterium]|nr:hypothetical protein [Acidobacteriota bacterium]